MTFSVIFLKREKWAKKGHFAPYPADRVPKMGQKWPIFALFEPFLAKKADPYEKSPFLSQFFKLPFSFGGSFSTMAR